MANLMPHHIGDAVDLIDYGIKPIINCMHKGFFKAASREFLTANANCVGYPTKLLQNSRHHYVEQLFPSKGPDYLPYY
jgi:hypothetical protein